jgi:hypothetical protein
MHLRQQRPAHRQLANTVPPRNNRGVSANDLYLGVLLPSDSKLAHFFLGDAVIENVRQISFRINPEAKLHSVVLSAGRRLSLPRIEPY